MLELQGGWPSWLRHRGLRLRITRLQRRGAPLARYLNRKGPLIVYGTEGSKIVKAFRNIPVVDVINVECLNLLKLAPGGHNSRFIIWTKSAFEELDFVYGTFDKSSEKKKGFVIPRPKMLNADLARIINSDQVQAVVKPTNREISTLALHRRRRNIPALHRRRSQPR